MEPAAEHTQASRTASGASLEGRGPKPKPWATAFLILLVPLFLSLGVWQLHRAEEKRVWRDARDEMMRAPALPLDYIEPDSQSLSDVSVGRRVSAKGRFDFSHQFLLDNQARSGVSGYMVLTPLLLESQSVVLVNRGWIAAGADRKIPPDLRTSEAALEIRGKIARPYRPALLLSRSDPEPMTDQIIRVQHADLAYVAKLLNRPILPVIVELDPDIRSGFLRQWTIAEINAERHTAYAVQWFALAGALLVILLRSTWVEKKQREKLHSYATER